MVNRDCEKYFNCLNFIELMFCLSLDVSKELYVKQLNRMCDRR